MTHMTYTHRGDRTHYHAAFAGGNDNNSIGLLELYYAVVTTAMLMTYTVHVVTIVCRELLCSRLESVTAVTDAERGSVRSLAWSTCRTPILSTATTHSTRQHPHSPRRILADRIRPTGRAALPARRLYARRRDWSRAIDRLARTRISGEMARR